MNSNFLDPKPGVLQAHQGLDLGSSAHVGLGEHNHRRGVGRYEARCRVVEAAAQSHPHCPLEQTDPEPPRCTRAIPLVGVVSVDGEPRAYCYITGIRSHQVQQSPQLHHWVLTISVNPATECVLAFAGLTVASGNSSTKTKILVEGHNDCAMVSGDGGRGIGRPVVDDQYIDPRKEVSKLIEYRGKVLFLIPGGDEHDRVLSESHRIKG